MGERRWRCSEQCDYHVCRCCFSDLDCIDKEYGPRSDVDCTDNKYVPGAPSSENADDGASESCSSEAYSEASTADSMPTMRFCGRLSEGSGRPVDLSRELSRLPTADSMPPMRFC